MGYDEDRGIKEGENDYEPRVYPDDFYKGQTDSLFGLNRRLRGAIAGHLALYEMTSSQPNRLYGKGFRRHGFDAEITWYFDEHVEADAVHEQIAGRDLAGGLVEAEPGLLQDVFFGAAAALAVDARVSAHIMDAWQNGSSSLRSAVPAAA